MTYYKPKQNPEWRLEQQYRTAPDSITIRQIEAGNKIFVPTFLSRKYVPKQEVKALCKNRWHVELDFRNIKTTLGMETLSCKTPDMAVKEIWTCFLAHNLIRIILAQAASLSELIPRQLSFKHSLQFWQACRPFSFDISDSIELLLLFQMIGENIIGNRPVRIEPRAVKRCRSLIRV